MQEVEVEGTVSETLEKLKGEVTSERLLEIIYRPQSLFRVRPVTRCTSSIPGKFVTPTFCLGKANLFCGQNFRDFADY